MAAPPSELGALQDSVAPEAVMFDALGVAGAPGTTGAGGVTGGGVVGLSDRFWMLSVLLGLHVEQLSLPAPMSAAVTSIAVFVGFAAM
jgi:hypothetical protein